MKSMLFAGMAVLSLFAAGPASAAIIQCAAPNSSGGLFFIDPPANNPGRSTALNCPAVQAAAARPDRNAPAILFAECDESTAGASSVLFAVATPSDQAGDTPTTRPHAWSNIAPQSPGANFDPNARAIEGEGSGNATQLAVQMLEVVDDARAIIQMNQVQTQAKLEGGLRATDILDMTTLRYVGR